MKTILFSALVLCCLYPQQLQAQAPPILWQHCYGGDSLDYINCIRQTNDHGFVTVGYTKSTDGDLAGNGGVVGLWAMKLDREGNIQWSKTYPNAISVGRAVEQCPDGGYIIAGYPTLKINPDGSEQWRANLSTENAHVTPDGGIITCGSTFIAKLKSDGSLLWQNTSLQSGGYGLFVNDVSPLPTSGYMVSGTSYDIHPSYVAALLNDTGGEVSSVSYDVNHGSGYNICATTDGNFLSTAVAPGLLTTLVRYNSLAAPLWAISTASYGQLSVTSLAPAAWGGGLLAGSDTNRISNLVLVAFDTGGHLLWQASAGGTMNDGAYSCLQSTDGPFLAAGYTYSNDGNVSGNHGNEDGWIVAFGSYSGVAPVPNASQEVSIYPVPAKNQLYIELPSGRENDEVQLVDVSGRTIPAREDKQGSKRILDLSGIASGCYIVHITGTQGATSHVVSHIN